MLQRFFATFMAGLLALLPLIVTLSVVSFVVSKIDAWLGPASPFGGLMQRLATKLGMASATLIYVVAFALVLLIVYLVGSLARRYTGRRIGAWVTSMVARVPFINKIYSSTDQVVALLGRRDGDAAAALSNVVMARIANVHVLGMLASPEPVDIAGALHYLVFVPATPIPASGQNVMVPVEDVFDVDISVEEMTKVLISLGSLGPGIMNSKNPLILPPKKP